MKKQKRSSKKKQQKKQFPVHVRHILFFIAAVVAMGIGMLIQQMVVYSQKTYAQNVLICPSPQPGRNTLQLSPCYLPSPEPTRRELIAVAPTPFPTPVAVVPLSPSPDNPTACGIAHPILVRGTDDQGNCCVEDGPVNNVSECCPGVPTCKQIQDDPEKYNTGGTRMSCNITGSDPNFWCDAKPIIYLYPEKKTTVDVVVTVPGTIPVSDPLYPDGGWKNIEAYPDGTLVYQQKVYKELFYEAAITPIDPPDNGIIVEKENVQSSLTHITTQLGLQGQEQNDFLKYWVPRLQELDSPYLLISVFSPAQKQVIDKVDITPKPDTFIEFIMYYKPLQQPIVIQPLILPETPPQRVGFTAVEWGGIIDEQ